VAAMGRMHQRQAIMSHITGHSIFCFFFFFFFFVLMYYDPYLDAFETVPKASVRIVVL
jgi:hypothetical protein